jgi:flagellar assembly factor FliW
MALVETPFFGKLEIDEGETFFFPEGIPGWEEVRRFVFIRPDESLPFSYMQSVDEPRLSFLTADPFVFYPDYEFDLPESVQSELEITSAEEVMVHAIVTMKAGLGRATVNLLAPVVVNRRRRLGKQVVLEHSPYKTRHPLPGGKGGSHAGTHP